MSYRKYLKSKRLIQNNQLIFLSYCHYICISLKCKQNFKCHFSRVNSNLIQVPFSTQLRLVNVATAISAQYDVEVYWIWTVHPDYHPH